MSDIDTHRMAQWIMARLDLAWPTHEMHREHTRGCPWCAIVYPLPPRDYRSDEEILLASAGALA